MWLGHLEADRGRTYCPHEICEENRKSLDQDISRQANYEKPAETRMGKGKGPSEGWVAVIRPGKVMYEIKGVPEDKAKEALRIASFKLPIKSRFVARSEEQ